MDDDLVVSWSRTALNMITKCVFADITRNLNTILNSAPSLKIVHYESLKDKLDGVFAKYIGEHYRLAVIVRDADYSNQPQKVAKLEQK